MMRHVWWFLLACFVVVTTTAARFPTRVTGYMSHSSSTSRSSSNNNNNDTLDQVLSHPGPLIVTVLQPDNLHILQSHNQTIVLYNNGTAIQHTNNNHDLTNVTFVAQRLFGIYSLPASNTHLLVWIVGPDKLVYQAPPIDDYGWRRWWVIAQITRLHITKLGNQPLSAKEAKQIALLRLALKQHEWYYCNSSTSSSSSVVKDITQSLQRSILQQEQDDRFAWNQQLLPERYRILQPWLVPVTSAFVGVQRNISLGQHNSNNSNTTIVYDQLVISRRSRFRAGTRFTRRGADAHGHVANAAETEQILLLYNQDSLELQAVCSHVQTRGSIPLRWSSPTDIKTYRPRVNIGTDPMAQAKALRAHLQECGRYYIVDNIDSKKHPVLVLCNLVDKKSDQGRLGKAFDAVLKAVLDVYNDAKEEHAPLWLNASGVQHIWFDFHAELKHGKWDKLASLLDMVKSTLVEQGYFLAVPNVTTGGFTVERIQNGVIRTNCMDCLDRTNVVQSVFGRFMAYTQLSDLKLAAMPLPLKTAFRRNMLELPWNEGEMAHRLLWADNADTISRLYAGTPALKGDFTRTGKRTKKGAIDDGMNSIQRYYLNNFLDADRQEGIDLLTGHQPFASAGDDEPDHSSISSSSNLSYRGMSLREAARRSLIGDWQETEGDSDRNHVRIKYKRDKRKLHRLPVGGAIDRRASLLDFRWLPGDLQSQVRSIATSSLDEFPDTFSAGGALQALDKRAASVLPWWVESDPSDAEGDVSSSRPTLAEVETAARNNPGYVLGALAAGTRSPVAMAVAVMAVMGAALPTSGGSSANH